VTSKKIYESHDLKVKQYDKHVNLLVAHNEVASDSVGHQSTPSHCHKMAIQRQAKFCVQSQNCSEKISSPGRTHIQDLATK